MAPIAGPHAPFAGPHPPFAGPPAGGIPGGHPPLPPPGGPHVWHHPFWHHHFWQGPFFGGFVEWPYYYDYPYGYYEEGECYLVRRRVKTRHGWRVRTFEACP